MRGGCCLSHIGREGKPFELDSKSLNVDLSKVKRASAVGEIARVRTVVEAMDRDLAECRQDP